MSASASSEEYFLARRLAHGLDCPNIDHRLREQDFSDDAARTQPAAFQSPMEAIDTADTILLIGSNIRHEAPILGQRVRKAWRNGAQIAALNPGDWNFHFSLANKLITAPQHMVTELAALNTRYNDLGFLAPLYFLALPIVDTFYVMFLRARAGRKIYYGSPDHIPLRLRRRLGGSNGGSGGTEGGGEGG